jgi:hypothetical protein
VRNSNCAEIVPSVSPKASFEPTISSISSIGTRTVSPGNIVIRLTSIEESNRTGANAGGSHLYICAEKLVLNPPCS